MNRAVPLLLVLLSCGRSYAATYLRLCFGSDLRFGVEHRQRYQRRATFGVGPDADPVLLEECYAYGGSRYTFLIYWADHMVVRRCVARKDYWTGSLQCASFVNYDSVNTTWQNNIAIDSDAANCTGGYYGGFWNENKNDHAPDTSETQYGNIELNIRSSTYADMCDDKISGTRTITNHVLWDSDPGY